MPTGRHDALVVTITSRCPMRRSNVTYQASAKMGDVFAVVVSGLLSLMDGTEDDVAPGGRLEAEAEAEDEGLGRYCCSLLLTCSSVSSCSLTVV